MSKEVETTKNHAPPAPKDGGKEPYQKPAFRHEGVFETMALACGKISSTQAQCRSLSKTS
jgi:hypothetical protein